MAEKMRMTAHNGRAGKDGAYSAKHNDRNFDTEKADNIDGARSDANRYWTCLKGKTFEDTEREIYEQLFGEGLKAKNERYLAQRHPERVQTLEDYRRNPRTCPEETILQIGKEGQTIDSDLLWEIAAEHIRWEQATFPNVKLLDVALHNDEQGAPHIHERKVWIGRDKFGDLVVGQSKALAEMGIEPPDPNAKYGKHNNAKMTYTAMCRAHFAEVCRSHGLDLELTPKEATESGLTLLEYQRRQEEEKVESLSAEAENLVQKNRILTEAEAQQIGTNAKPSRLNPKNVVVPKDDFDRLMGSAKVAEAALSENRKLRNRMDRIESDADERVRRAQTTPTSEKLEYTRKIVELEEKLHDYQGLERIYPEVFSRMRAEAKAIGVKHRNRE